MEDLKRMEKNVSRLCSLYLRAAPGEAKEEAHQVRANAARHYEKVFAESLSHVG